MRVFVAYGYNDRDKWIKDLVLPLIQAFGYDVVTGENTHGNPIICTVVQEIKGSDALIAFLTRRMEQGSLTNRTHEWVSQEVGSAMGKGAMLLPVREEGLDNQEGMTAGHQHITYREAEREKCLVEIATALGKWRSKDIVRLQLFPQERAAEIKALLKEKGFRVQYGLLQDGREEPLSDTKILRIGSGLYVDLKDVRKDALVQLQIDCQGKSWSSSYVTMNSVGIHLERDN